MDIAIDTDQAIARHYADGSLTARVDAALASVAAPDAVLREEDISGLDQFHTGGLLATQTLAPHMQLAKGQAVLDIGCGLGGPARYLARHFGCRMTGVDLTPEYVAIAGSLNERLGEPDAVDFVTGSGLDLPFDAGRFDRAYMLHVGMNIADKHRLCAETARVLRPDGLFIVYDLMLSGEGDLSFPVPWASRPEMSFVEPPETYRAALTAAGFDIEAENDHRELGLEHLETMRARTAEFGPPTLGIHLLLGPETPTKIGNLIAMLQEGLLTPVEMVARRK